jgi:hypothetical protein
MSSRRSHHQATSRASLQPDTLVGAWGRPQSRQHGARCLWITPCSQHEPVHGGVDEQAGAGGTRAAARRPVRRCRRPARVTRRAHADRRRVRGRERPPYSIPATRSSAPATRCTTSKPMLLAIAEVVVAHRCKPTPMSPVTTVTTSRMAAEVGQPTPATTPSLYTRAREESPVGPPRLTSHPPSSPPHARLTTRPAHDRPAHHMPGSLRAQPKFASPERGGRPGDAGLAHKPRQPTSLVYANPPLRTRAKGSRAPGASLKNPQIAEKR